MAASVALGHTWIMADQICDISIASQGAAVQCAKPPAHTSVRLSPASASDPGSADIFQKAGGASSSN